ncbi:LacI family DNA-binding transcriptional regulator [Mycolicibacterium wolinskyi]|uniref:LacI family transcriptional regulator n=1 Tax=Mycolicibacterium wolinskyi TaxID=59750 RepID=A0A1X2ESJ4_9MYCO|nr:MULTISPECIES: LacI family DNA-binding transcriptional regulator [Mycolicibacterium]MCV7287333.1 LacI family DNA-binding transcriptional regulator [Mycolicibacterium wolinskyi]MCV7295028.1 LacI family DNA-binding transcriptional regulator [Mycolicibacterium goodii]ORX09155.1 LacI family transcriptional regulator [Mycolicibacterium wolinskyi]
MVTMKDVAKAAGVSQAAVSYAYSGSPRVSARQREQIFSVAAQLGYTGPNIAGSSLRLGRIGTVGVLVPGSLASAVEDPSTTLLLKGIVEVGELADVALTLLPVDRTGITSGPSQPVQSAALRGLVDGVVMHCLPNEHPVVEAIIARRIPAVAIDSPRLPAIPYVTVDHRQAGAEQMKHVLALGHRRVGIVTDRLGPAAEPGRRQFSDIEAVTETYLQQRLAGYRDAIAAGGRGGIDATLVEATDIDMSSGMLAVEQLIDGPEPPTAIVATSDVHAVAAMKVLEQRQLSVPEQVSVIGFDDAPIADLVGLTTIRQPLCDKGKTAASMLLDLIDGRSRRRSVKPTELILRSSTGPARK